MMPSVFRFVRIFGLILTVAATTGSFSTAAPFQQRESDSGQATKSKKVSKKIDQKKFIEKEYRKFHEKIIAGQDKDRIKAIKEIILSKEDLIEIFGKQNGETLENHFATLRKMVLKNHDDVKKDFLRIGKLKSVKIINMEPDLKRSKILGDLKKHLKKKITFYRLNSIGDKSRSSSSSYFVFKNKLRYLPGIEMVPFTLKEAADDKGSSGKKKD